MCACVCVPLLVCLFVCWNQTRQIILRLLIWEGSKPPGNDHTRAGTKNVCTKGSGTYHVRVNLWLALYKLTGWLASLDLAAPTQRLILSHRTTSPDYLYGVLVLERGRSDWTHVQSVALSSNLPVIPPCHRLPALNSEF